MRLSVDRQKLASRLLPDRTTCSTEDPGDRPTGVRQHICFVDAIQHAFHLRLTLAAQRPGCMGDTRAVI